MLKMDQALQVKLNKKNNMAQGFNPKGKFIVEHIRKGKIINKFEVPNGVTTEGLIKVLNVMFGSESKLSDWYIGLIQDGGYTGVAAGDTMSSHSGWTEFTGYDETDRVEWTPADASGSASIANNTARAFNINTGDTLKGIFVCSSSTKSGTSGTLWATALFASDIAVNNGDTLNITYTVTAS